LQLAAADRFEYGAVLFVDAKFQRLLIVFIQREKIMVIIRAAMEDAALEVNGSINQGVHCAAIFGLHM
jgi:hypothetical protein